MLQLYSHKVAFIFFIHNFWQSEREKINSEHSSKNYEYYDLFVDKLDTGNISVTDIIVLD